MLVTVYVFSSICVRCCTKLPITADGARLTIIFVGGSLGLLYDLAQLRLYIETRKTAAAVCIRVTAAETAEPDKYNGRMPAMIR